MLTLTASESHIKIKTRAAYYMEYLMRSSFGRTQRAEAISIGQKGSKYYVACGSPDRCMFPLTENTKEVGLKALLANIVTLRASENRASERISRPRAHDRETMADLGGPKDAEDT